MARGQREQVRVDKLNVRLSDLISGVAKSHAAVVAGMSQELPVRFERAAKTNYDKVLGRISGNLYRSIEGFARRKGGDLWEIGLRDKMAYARFLEYGTKRIKPRRFLGNPMRSIARGWIRRVIKRVSFDG